MAKQKITIPGNSPHLPSAVCPLLNAQTLYHSQYRGGAGGKVYPSIESLTTLWKSFPVLWHFALPFISYALLDFDPVLCILPIRTTCLMP